MPVCWPVGARCDATLSLSNCLLCASRSGLLYPPTAVRYLLQPGVFCLGLLEDRDVGVGALPESEEFLESHVALGSSPDTTKALPSCRRARAPTGSLTMTPR